MKCALRLLSFSFSVGRRPFSFGLPLLLLIRSPAPRLAFALRRSLIQDHWWALFTQKIGSRSREVAAFSSSCLLIDAGLWYTITDGHYSPKKFARLLGRLKHLFPLVFSWAQVSDTRSLMGVNPPKIGSPSREVKTFSSLRLLIGAVFFFFFYISTHSTWVMQSLFQ